VLNCVNVCVQNILYTPAGGHFFIYFTNWTFVLFGLTALLGTALTVKVSVQYCSTCSQYNVVRHVAEVCARVEAYGSHQHPADACHLCSIVLVGRCRL
jgi:hypothetical protein